VTLTQRNDAVPTRRIDLHTDFAQCAWKIADLW
jgi:hypothetical protein